MAIPTKESLSGFIKSTPRLTRTSNGNARFFAWTGIPQSEYDGAGNYTELEPAEAPLVMFGASAERAHEQFRKGDNFIAEGKTGTWNREVDGQQVEEAQFVASRIGHDNNITNYTVERRAPERQAERDTAARDAAQADATQAEAAGGAATRAAQPEAPLAGTVGGGPAVGDSGQAAGPAAGSAGVQAQVAEVLAQREAQVTAEPATSQTHAQHPAHEPVSR